MEVFIALGSNLGDREDQIRRALRRLEETGTVAALRVSSLYESEPVGWDGGPWYLNAVACGETPMEPEALLAALEAIEAGAGREPGPRNAPRPLDLDLLLYDRRTIRTPTLEVPHPRMLGRAFVLWPLAELDPEVEVVPGITAWEAAEALRQHESIRLWRGKEEDRDAALPL